MKDYLSPSSFNRYSKCSAAALAVERGEWKFDFTTPMKVGSYVDAYFSGTLDKFKEENPDIYTKGSKNKAPALRADFVKAEEIIELIKSDPLFFQYVTGKTQVKVSGTIGGVKFLGYVDSLHSDSAIVDLKIIKDVFGKAWNNDIKAYESWVDAYGYVLQGAVYQELVRQMTGKKLPFFIAAVDKKPVMNHELIHIPDDRMYEELERAKHRSSEFMKIRSGKLPPVRCGKCDYCISTKKIKDPISYLDLFNF